MLILKENLSPQYTVWICPDCKAVSSFIDFQPSRCLLCEYRLPIFNNLKHKEKSRIYYYKVWDKLNARDK